MENKESMHIEFTTSTTIHDNTHNSGITSCSCAQWENFMELLICDLLLYMDEHITIEQFHENYKSRMNESDKHIMDKWREYNSQNDCTTIASFRYMIESNRDFLILLTKFHLNGIYNLVYYNGDGCFSSGQARDILLALTAILSSTDRDGEYKEWLETLFEYLQGLNYNMDFELHMRLEY